MFKKNVHNRWLRSVFHLSRKSVSLFFLFLSILGASSFVFFSSSKAAIGNISGTVVDSYGSATGLADKTVSLLVNESFVTSVETDENGEFTFAEVLFTNNDLLTLYIDDEDEKAVTIFKLGSEVVDGNHELDLAAGTVWFTGQDESAILSYADLSAAGYSDSDITDLVVAGDDEPDGEQILVASDFVLTGELNADTLVFVGEGDQKFHNEQTLATAATFVVRSTGATFSLIGTADLPNATLLWNTDAEFVHTGSIQLAKLELVSGTFTAPGDGATVTLQEMVVNGGANFVHNSAPIIFAGANLSLLGDGLEEIAFQNLSVVGSEESSFTVESGLDIQVSGQLSLRGEDASNRLAVQPSDGGSFRFVLADSATVGSLEYLRIEGSEVEVDEENASIELPLDPTGSLNGGQNSGWFGVTVSLLSDGAEPETAAIFQLETTAINDSGSPFTVNFLLNNGTATAGLDFSDETTTGEIQHGNSTGEIWIEILDDAIAEGTENFSLELVSADSLVVDTPSVEADIIDDDTIGVLITPTSVTSTEGGATGSYDVELESQPLGNVVITATPDSNSSLSSTTLTFTTENWNQAQTVTVTAVDDSRVEDEHTSTITHAINTSLTQDEFYDALSGLSSVTNTITDNDSPGFSLSDDALTIAENAGSDEFTVVLTKAPLSNVVFSVASSNTNEATVSPTTLTFTTENWNEAQTVVVTGVDDAVVRNDSAVITISVHESSNALWTGLSAQTVDVTLTDNDSAGVQISPTALSTSEAGDSDMYSITLSSEPTGAVVISISTDTDQNTLSKLSVEFTPQDWDEPQTIEVSAVNDDIVEGEHSVTIYHEIDTNNTEDVVYDTLENLASVTNTITDNDTGSIVLSTDSVTISEASGTTQVSVSLSAQPVGSVTLSVDSADTNEATVSPSTLTFTTENWDDTQDITITGVNDDVDRDDSTSIVVAVVNDSSHASWSDLSESISVILTDDDTAGVTVNPTSISTSEGSGATQYSVRLNTQPLGDVTITVNPDDESQVSPASLTFTSENWDDPQNFSATAINDVVVEGEHSSTITHSATSELDGKYDGMSIASVTNTITDNDEAGFSLSTTSLSIEEGSSDTFTVTLNAEPLTAVTLYIASSDTNEATVSPSSVELNSTNWQTGVSVTVNSVEDSHIREDSATITVSVSEDNEEPWDSLEDQTVSVEFQENDTAGVTISPTTISTTEGGATATYSVVLISQPSGNVVITLSPDSQSSTNKESLTFTTGNWGTPQEVTVTAVDDAQSEGTHVSTILHTINTTLTADSNYDNLDELLSVTNTITDNDTPGFSVDPSSLNIQEGTSDFFAVVLDAQPLGNVVIDISSSNTSVATVSKSSLVFTSENWNQAQQVTVNAVNNSVIGNGSATLTLTLDSEASHDTWEDVEDKTISVNVTDDDEVGVMLNPSSVEIPEGESRTVEISLSSQPQNSTTVSFVLTPSSDELDLGNGVGEAVEMLFTDEDWNTSQTLTIATTDNDIRDGNRDASVSVTINQEATTDSNYSDWDLAEELNVTIVDDERDPEPQESKSKKSRSTSSKEGDRCSVQPPTSAPELFQISVTNTTAELAFVPSENATHYAVRYSTSAEGEEYATLFEHRDNSGVVLTSIHDLTPGTTYYFTVRGLNDCAPGEWSAQLSATTTRTASAQDTFYAGGEISNPSASVNIPSIQRATPLPQAEQNAEEREDTESNGEPGAPSNEADTSTETPVQPTSFLQRLWNGIQNLFR